MPDPDPLDPLERRHQRLAQRLAAAERQVEQLLQLLELVPAGQLAAFGATLAEHEHRLNNLESP